MSSRAVVCASKEVHACPWSRLGIAAERPRSPSVSAPHRESLARPTGPGLLTYLIVPKVPKVRNPLSAYGAMGSAMRGHRAAEVTKAEHMLFIGHRRGQPARRQYQSMLVSPRSQEEASLCSMRPASAACACVAGNSSTAFRRTCLWKTIAKTRFTRTPRAVRRLDISPPRSSATNESPDAARARRAASAVLRFLKPVHR